MIKNNHTLLLQTSHYCWKMVCIQWTQLENGSIPSALEFDSTAIYNSLYFFVWQMFWKYCTTFGLPCISVTNRSYSHVVIKEKVCHCIQVTLIFKEGDLVLLIFHKNFCWTGVKNFHFRLHTLFSQHSHNSCTCIYFQQLSLLLLGWAKFGMTSSIAFSNMCKVCGARTISW